MKKTILGAVLAIAVSVCGTAFGRALVTEGSNEIGISGMLDFASEVGTSSALDLRYGYFFADQWSVGFLGGFSDNDYYTNIRLGVGLEYNFMISDDYRPLIGTDFVPFIGLGVGAQFADSDEDDEFAGVGSAELGAKFFLSDDCAVVLSALGQLATEDIFMNDHKSSSADLSLRLGMRFYF